MDPSVPPRVYRESPMAPGRHLHLLLLHLLRNPPRVSLFRGRDERKGLHGVQPPVLFLDALPEGAPWRTGVSQRTE